MAKDRRRRRWAMRTSGERSGRIVVPLTPAARVALKPITTFATTVLTILILVEATRRGQLPDIAGYSAGVSLGAVVSGLVGSGTSLAYLTGDEVAQSGVRRVRYLVVAPAMFVAVLTATLLYNAATELDVLPILIGGVSAVLSNLAELESASLERKLEVPKLLIASSLSRLLGFLSLFAGMSFSRAMLASAIAAYVMLRIFARGHRVAVRDPPRLRVSLRHAYSPSLMAISVLGITVNRAVLIVAPFLMSPQHAGALSALISGQQSIAGVLISGLYTLMAARSEAGAAHDWMHRVAGRTLVLAGVVAVAAALAAPFVVDVLNLGTVPKSTLWWGLLGLAIFPYVYNRRSQYAFLGEGKRKKAVMILGLNAGFTLIVCGIAAGVSSPTLLAAVSLISEAVTVTVVIVVLRFFRMAGGIERQD